MECGAGSSAAGQRRPLISRALLVELADHHGLDHGQAFGRDQRVDPERPRHGEHLLLADEPDAFAAAVVQALDDAALRRRLAAAARTLVYARYDWDAVMPRFLDLVDDVALHRARRA